MKISFIIPCYNAGNYLASAIRSIADQKTDFFFEREVIVIDDGSDDGSVDRLSDPGVLVLRQDHGRAAKARNLGLSHATGDFIFLLDADDVLAESAVQNLFRSFREDEALMASFGKAKEFVSEEIAREETEKIRVSPEPISGVLPGCSLIRKSVFDTVGLFDAALTSGETVDYMMRMRKSGVKSVQIPDITLYRRIHLSNTGRLHKDEERKNYAQIMLKQIRERTKS